MRSAIVYGALMLLLCTASLPAFQQSIPLRLRGTIPQHVSITVSDLQGSSATLLSPNDSARAVVEATYSGGGTIEIPRAITFSNISSNVPIYLELRNSGWQLPPGYDMINGSKRADGSDDDFRVRVRTYHQDAGTLDVVGTAAQQYSVVSNQAVGVLKLGTVNGRGKYIGVRGGYAELDAQIVLDPLYDVPGDYAVELEVTISSQI